jgi:general secretion pathway protein B
VSFILEALRKSEAARRRSEAPGLFSAMRDAPAPARERRQAPVWIVGIVGVLSLAVATWLVLQRDPAPTAPTPQAAIVDAPADAPADAPVAAPVMQVPQPAQPVASSPPPAPPVTAPAPPPARASVATTPAAAPAAAPLPESLPEPPPASRPPAPRPAGDGRPMALSALDAGTRKQLPALRMSMHMWNEDAGRRFVILDGQRVGEGDLIGEAQVESITRDGVILNWQGVRLRIGTR